MINRTDNPMNKNSFACFWQPIMGLCLILVMVLFLSPGRALAQHGLMNLDLRDADMRDVLSSLAIEMGSTIIYMDNEAVNVTFKADNIAPMEALNIILKSHELVSAPRGGVILVGKKDKISADYILTRFDFRYILPAQVKEVIDGLDLDVKSFLISTNPNSIWVRGSTQSLAKVREAVCALDIKENQQLAQHLEYRFITVTQIPPERVVELLNSAGIPLQNYIISNNELLVFQRELFSQWNEIEMLVAQLDKTENRKENSFVYQLRNVTAKDAGERLKQFKFGDGSEVKWVTYNNDNMGYELLVICPPHLTGAVREALASIDLTRGIIRAPIATLSGKDASSALSNKRSLLSELSGVPVAKMHISNNLSGDFANPTYALWVEATPDKIKLLQDMEKELSGSDTED